ncbi:ABC transporter permease [Luteimicrobium subarcticum]|uniref:ABC-type nitrate/sulfonate/bicarbonate transport system permease component n=1 Tax=Luteimicrobium subarcticum TaxID=620910 RepID=A0A2M8W1B0_9MICO|nr:ABC transporter permease subunit [Luteimicrobium subarcticum]PJI84721.1 ABC-type nitrate/sulfonate/bicarbonate transport system permease component [Luteimicrobium subarcticum]
MSSSATYELALVRRRVRRQAARSVLGAVGRSLLTFVLTVALVLVIWWGVLAVFHVDPFVAKSPADVWEYLVTSPRAAEHRADVLDPLGTTLVDALIGFTAGLLAALVGATVFQLSKGVENALMPVAMLLRSVPLIAMAPVIIMIFGRGTAVVAVIGGIVVLFPALVTIAYGLKQAPPASTDLVHVYGGGSWSALRKVALPASLPSFFAAVRISVPGAITGALLAEWLATGTGIGHAVSEAKTQVQFSFLWSSVVVVTAVSLVLYNLVALLESIALARAGMKQTQV